MTAAPGGEARGAPVLDPAKPQHPSRRARRHRSVGALPALLAALLATVLAACGASSPPPPTETARAETTTAPVFLPGTGRPPVTIGDKNFPEQFILGELYSQALTAQGYTVILDKNIGSTQVTAQALQQGQLDMYPEYLGTFNTAFANNAQAFGGEREAYGAAQRYAIAHGLRLLRATPFSDTDAIAVLASYGAEHHLRGIADLRRLQSNLALGAPPQFATSQAGLLGMQSVYGVTPAHVQPLAIGLQYQALQSGSVQAADVFTTDGELASGQYQLLRDPARLFGFGNVVPVVTQGALLAEGPAFAHTINSVSAQLTTQAMRQLNSEVNVYNMAPADAARQFLLARGLLGG